jgi:hypothetical protein
LEQRATTASNSTDLNNVEEISCLDGNPARFHSPIPLPPTSGDILSSGRNSRTNSNASRNGPASRSVSAEEVAFVLQSISTSTGNPRTTPTPFPIPAETGLPSTLLYDSSPTCDQLVSQPRQAPEYMAAHDNLVEVGRLVLTRDRIRAFQLPDPPAQAHQKEVDEFFSDMDNGPTEEELKEQWKNWFMRIKHLIKVTCSVCVQVFINIQCYYSQHLRMWPTELTWN